MIDRGERLWSAVVVWVILAAVAYVFYQRYQAERAAQSPPSGRVQKAGDAGAGTPAVDAERPAAVPAPGPSPAPAAEGE